MLNYVFAEQLSEKTETDGSETDVLSLKLPGNIENPQDWLIIASAEVTNYSGSTPYAGGSGRTNVRFYLDTTMYGRVDMGTQGITTAGARNPFYRLFTHVMLKDFVGGAGGTTYGELKFTITNDSSSKLVDIARVKGMRILGIRIPKTLKGEKLFFENTTDVDIGTGSDTAFGEVTFTPDKGKYLVISTAQVDFATSSAPAIRDLNVRMEIYQHEDASTEQGATNKLLVELPPNHGSATTGNFYLEGFDTSRSFYPVTLMTIQDFDNVPTTIVWQGQSVGGSTDPKIIDLRTTAIPLDGNFVYDYAQVLPAEHSSHAHGTSYEEHIKDFSVGVADKNTYVIACAHTYTEVLGIIMSRINCGSAGIKIGDLADGDQSMNISAEVGSHLAAVFMINGVDTVSLEHARNSVSAPTEEPYMSSACVLALTDMQSQQTDLTVTKDIEMEHDIAVPEDRHPIDHATALALEEVAEEGSPLNTNVEYNIMDYNTERSALSCSDTGIKLVGSTYTRDDEPT